MNKNLKSSQRRVEGTVDEGTCISSTIERLIEKTVTNNSCDDEFIACPRWQGSRKGYVFGSCDLGTGYYVDRNGGGVADSVENGGNGDGERNVKRAAGYESVSRKRSRSSASESRNETKDGDSRSVRFGSNSIKTIPARRAVSSTSNKTADQLLQEAEESLASQLHPRKTLTFHQQNQSQHQNEQHHTKTNSTNSTNSSSSSSKSSSSSSSKSQQNQQLKSHILALEKNITKNQFQRAQYPDTPEKFMESELALHDDISSLQDMAAAITHYDDFVALGAVDTLVTLLQHDNADVSVAVLALFVELLDPALVGTSDNNHHHHHHDHDQDHDHAHTNTTDLERDGLLVGRVALAFLGNAATDTPHKTLSTTTKHDTSNHSSTAITTNGGLEMCVSNLHRFDHSQEEDLKGVDDLLTLVENLLDLDRMGVFRLIANHCNRNPVIDHDAHTHTPYEYRSVASILIKYTTLTSYLLMKLGHKKLDDWNMPLRLHASEVLTSIIQHEDSTIHLCNLTSLPPYTSMFQDDDDNDNNDNNNNNNNSKKNNKKPPQLDGMEALLQSIAPYRKKDPATEEECEYLQNMFDALAASLLHQNTTTEPSPNTNTNTTDNISAFLERQGVELMVRCISERVHAGSGALRVLSFAVSSPSHHIAEAFVQAGGLRKIFPIFMGRRAAIPKPAGCSDAGNVGILKKYGTARSHGTVEEGEKRMGRRTKRVVSANRDWFQGTESHAVHIVYGLTRYLTDASPHDAKARLLSKFVEFDCEKCDRLVELCTKYDTRMRNAEYRYYKSNEAEEAEEEGIVDVDLVALSAKLRGGGDLFHRVGAIVAFAAVGSKRCHQYILEQLRTQNSGIGVVKAALEEFASLLDDDSDQRHQLCKYLDAI